MQQKPRFGLAPRCRRCARRLGGTFIFFFWEKKKEGILGLKIHLCIHLSPVKAPTCRTRVSPDKAPLDSLRWRAEKSARRTGMSRYETCVWNTVWFLFIFPHLEVTSVRCLPLNYRKLSSALGSSWAWVRGADRRFRSSCPCELKRFFFWKKK